MATHSRPYVIETMMPYQRSFAAPAPAFVIHDATGSCIWLSRALGDALPCPLFGINQLPGDAERVRSVDELAQKYLAAVRGVQAEGPVTLIAYGFGCRIALAMGLLLQAARE